MLFSEQTDLDNIQWNSLSDWLEKPEITDDKELQDLYNEKNFYYEFVHPVLYDKGEGNSILKHFERKEPQQREVSYIISKKGGKTYTLKLDALNLNLYETGVGMLSFFLKNEREDQKELEDILTINQYGRRIFPPFFGDVENRYEIAAFISIEGLNGDPSLFYEDFSGYANGNKLLKKPWTPACFINNLITDLYDDLVITPVIDDRMFVNCWYTNDEITKEYRSCDEEELKEFYIKGKKDFWYKYIYVDANSLTCKNDKMRFELLEKQTYSRWQKDGMLYGVSRYSFVFLTKNNEFQNKILAVYMRTVYSRMIELILIQRASVLRFSDEISHVGQLSKVKSMDKRLVERINSIYKEYIRFTNQIYFREVTTQDQGIELYNLLSETLNLQKHVEGLDKEIEELYRYVTLVDDKIRNKNAEILNRIAAIFLPAALIAGLFGMNSWCDLKDAAIQSILVLLSTIIMFTIIQLINKKK
jgi:Mg2+ and Co2+ transporter CorA